MSKIICDICGTEYPETADQCPICGSAKQVGSDIVFGATAGSDRAVKTGTKGGRFSNANVRKRNKGKKVSAASKKSASPAPKARFAENKTNKGKTQDKDEKANRGLLAVVWLLLIAIVLVLIYIVVQFVLPMYGIKLPDLLNKPADTTTSAVADDTTAQVDTTPEDTSVACTGLRISGGDIVLEALGRVWLLEVTAEPANTTDMIIYESADENVAIVSDQGRVSAVGPGKTVITVTCGSVSKQISVECPFGEVTTLPEETTIPEETTVPATSEEPTTEEPTTEEPTESTEATEPPVDDFGLFKQDDVTLVYKGETFEFESGNLYLSEIEWSSDDPSVATVVNGEVTAVGPGTTVIRGKYNGKTDSCIIRCEFSSDSGESGGNESDADHPEWPYLYPSTDVSIAVGEAFELTYVNVDGEWPDIDWVSDDSSIASVDGNWVTGVSYGVTTIRGTYNGVEITCIVRVIL